MNPKAPSYILALAIGDILRTQNSQHCSILNLDLYNISFQPGPFCNCQGEYVLSNALLLFYSLKPRLEIVLFGNPYLSNVGTKNISEFVHIYI